MKKEKTKIPPLMKLIKKAKFDYVNYSINDTLFQQPGELLKYFKIYHFNKNISTEDAIQEIEKDEYRPANAWELVNYAIEGWNGTDWVVGLGSVAEVDGDRGVPYLGGDVSERFLGLYDWGGAWSSRGRFLGVRNGSKTLNTLSPTQMEKNLESLTNLTLERAIEMVKKEGYVIYKKI